MKVRFQADADLNEIILLATIRQRSEIDFRTAMAAELVGVSDPEVLELCAPERVEYLSRTTEKQCLVTSMNSSSAVKVPA